MTGDIHNAAAETPAVEQDKAQPPTSVPSLQKAILPLPGLAAISLYLLVLAAVIVLGVVSGSHYPPLYLVFSAAFISASGGLLLLFRWAWALALAAVLLLVVYNLWIFSSLHQGAALVQGLLNLVFFLYLVRPEVRERLR
jgi:hypothetical protein